MIMSRTIVALILLCSWNCGFAIAGESKSPISTNALIVVAGLDWHTDYMKAYRAARQTKRMLLINFVPVEENLAQHNLDKAMATNDHLQNKLRGVVRARLPVDTEISLEGKSMRLISHGAFAHMEGKAGIAMLDLKHQEAEHYGRVVSAFPFTQGKYYRWQDNYLSVVLDLPPGTITQRTMIWAVRIHPEQPASTSGEQDPQLAHAAASHSQHQANLDLQGHHQWESRFHQIRAQVSANTASEVVAESWPHQNMIDSCLDCVASWRYSSGHWRAVRSRHRLFGYDIRRSRKGIWYGTGIFAN